MRVAPLTDDGVAQIVAQHTSRPPGSRLRARLAGAAGNPLLVGEFLRSAKQLDAVRDVDGRAELDDSAGDLTIGVEAAVLARLPGLSGPATELLTATAVVGPCSLDWLAPILECTPSTLRAAACEATEAGFLDPGARLITLRHELLGDALRSRVSNASQAALHLHVGRHLAATGGPACLVAHHLELGSPTPDAVTIRWLRRAATEAAVIDPARAAELLGRAVDAMSITDPERPAVLAERARSLVWLGRRRDARACALEGLARSAEPATTAALHASLAETCLLDGRPGEAVRHLENALAVSIDDRREHARLLARAATVRLWSFDLPGAAADAETALAEAELAGDPVAATTALNVSSRMAAFRLDLRRAVSAGEEAVARAGELAAALRSAPHLYLGLARINTDDWAGARDALREGSVRCEALGAAWAVPGFHGALALLGFFTGDWDDALDAATTAALAAADAGSRTGQAQIDAIVGLIAHHRGDDATAVCSRPAGHCGVAASGCGRRRSAVSVLVGRSGRGGTRRPDNCRDGPAGGVLDGLATRCPARHALVGAGTVPTGRARWTARRRSIDRG